MRTAAHPWPALQNTRLVRARWVERRTARATFTSTKSTVRAQVYSPRWHSTQGPRLEAPDICLRTHMCNEVWPQ